MAYEVIYVDKEIDLSAYLTTEAAAATYATTTAVAAGYQPLDSDLTAIAALTTTSTGRALLTESVAQTGTGALVRAASPTVSGTLNVAAIAASGTIAVANNGWFGSSSASALQMGGSATFASSVGGTLRLDIGTTIKIPSTSAYCQTSGNAQGTTDCTFSRASAGVWQCGTTANNALGSLLLTNLTASGSGNFGGSGVATPSTVGGAVVYARQTGGSTNTWRGRIVAGGDNVAFLMGEYNSQAWLGGHNAALNAWVPLRINPDGSAALHLGNNGSPGSTAVLRLENNDATSYFAGPMTLATYTVATLPSASTHAGRFAQVTDSNSTTNGNTVAGGGSNRVPVFSNGTNWIIK